MSLPTFMLYFFEGFAALAAVGVLFSRNVLHAALYLIVCLLAMAGIYTLVLAEFLAVTQILIYAGGILIIIIFGIMLTVRITGKPLRVESQNLFVGLFVAGSLFSALLYSIRSANFRVSIPVESAVNNVNEVGVRIMSDYVAPFELAGILLLVSLIGAALTASHTKFKL